MVVLPAAARKVGNQSRPEKMPFCTESAGTWPGQRRMHGTRKPPSITVPLHWANGVVPPSGQVKSSVPLSVVKTTIVLSSSPMSLSFCSTKPMSLSSWAMPASCSDQPFREVRDDVHARRVEPAEERLAVRLGLVDELQGEIADFVVHRFHALGIERAGVLDFLLADPAPARHLGRVV